jgi:hypothetical protein
VVEEQKIFVQYVVVFCKGGGALVWWCDNDPLFMA